MHKGGGWYVGLFFSLYILPCAFSYCLQTNCRHQQQRRRISASCRYRFYYILYKTCAHKHWATTRMWVNMNFFCWFFFINIQTFQYILSYGFMCAVVLSFIFKFLCVYKKKRKAIMKKNSWFSHLFGK